jgi:LPXTG-site transpeptidase (sortase) family protein
MSRRRLLFLALSLTMMAAGVAALVLAIVSPTTRPRSFPEPQAFFAPSVEPTPRPPEPTPTPPPSEAPVERIILPRLGIDAPVILLGVDKDGVMQSPSGATQVGWYGTPEFYDGGNDPRPGWGGNAVFSGHVYLDKIGRSVFWRLREVRAGDEVIVRLEDGVTYAYEVISATTYPWNASENEVQEIVSRTEVEAITLITCAGDIIPGTLQLDRRLVVRAVRVFPPAPGPESTPEPAVRAAD